MPRKIIHVDMDAFYASVEQRDDPSLRGRPVAVGGSARRGVVAAASYEARVFGVRSAMPSVTAKRRCPELVFITPRFDHYRAISRQLRAIFARYSALVEPLSLDEAYLDVTDDRAGLGSATATARAIRAAIREETGLTASAGVSYNKFLAKIASDQHKPDGLCVITPQQGPAFVADLPVRRFHGVGPRTAERMARLGIHTGAELRACELVFLEKHFGKFAAYLHGAARGLDGRPVRPERQRKSIGAERTFGEDLKDSPSVLAALDRIAGTLWARVEGQPLRGRTVTVKVKYSDFRLLTRARSVAAPVETQEQLRDLAAMALASLLPPAQGVRLLGIALSALAAPEPPAVRVGEPPPAQQTLAF
ncbi:DNA polymerase IV [Pseudohaliea rubra DSM 19751]|uniref:DNA polymerase IV n=1 Tax=Pseudohaliea rubra DSM 19751 TaxID=1265313 RepID=A0A095X2I9_9GAMM|nr:DNA polymerase IV [Pseudohaliea rubra DSM 19751]